MKKLYALISILFIALCSHAQTNVSGGIYANTTWTLAGSPYIVVDTVVVFPGVTLTIDPGVVVKFDNNMSLEVRNATLVAEGNVVDSITFTSNSLTPTPGIWKQVWFSGTSPLSKFNYCNFSYAMRGLYNFRDAIGIKNSKFLYNICGLVTIHNTIIDSCDFKFNTSGGIDYTSTCVVNFCTFSNNTVYGFMGAVRTEITNCILDSNQYGLNGSVGLSFIDNCRFNNNQYGVRLESDNRMQNCIISNNSLYGLITTGDGADTVINCVINNNGVGLLDGSCSFPSQSIIMQCVIEGNNKGIQLQGCSDIICNRICNNITYDLENLTTSAYNISENFWCTADSDTVAIHIYDGFDDVSRGLVTFMPLDLDSCYLSGCMLAVSAAVINATCDTCHNGSATANITYGFPPYSYTWYTSPIQYSQTATALAAGTYTICVTDASGCTSCNYNIFVDSTNCTGFAVNATATNASCSACSDGTGTANITGGSGPFAYTWYTIPIQTTQTATGLPQGSYAVCVTDVYGCVACDTATIGVGSCSAYYTIAASGSPNTYDLTNMASGSPPLTFDWSWGDGSPNDTGAYPSHTYPMAGNYTICLSIIDSAGCTDSYCNTFYLLSPSSTPVTVNVIPPISSGVAAAKEESVFTIFPNPTSADITVQLENTTDAVITIYNTLGDKVYATEIINRNSHTIHTDFPSGIYFIEVRDGASVSRERFVKQ
jgi:hypothetical protein